MNKILLFVLRLTEIILAFGIPVFIELFFNISIGSLTGRRIIYAISSLALLFIFKISFSKIENKLIREIKIKQNIKDNE
jgi:hypothetical protein